MRMMKIVFGIAGVLIALSAGANAQTVVFNAVGSSAQFLELGQAAGSSTLGSPAGLGATCVWSNNQGSDSTHAINVTRPVHQPGGNRLRLDRLDARTNRLGNSDCTVVNAATNNSIYVFLQTDSVIGDRCFFNGCKFGTTQSPSGSSPDHLIFPTGSSPAEIPLVPAVWNAVNGTIQNAAGTDIRPEDAAFATLRGTTACDGQVAGSSYRGLGYISAVLRSRVNIAAAHSTSPPSPSVRRAPLALRPSEPFRSSSLSTPATPMALVPLRLPTSLVPICPNILTDPLETPTTWFQAPNSLTTVVLREPLSGTYNTMEYGVPNSTTRFTSQDVGLTQPAGQKACHPDGTPVNPMNIVNAEGGYRNRAIGTGQEISVVENLTAPLAGTPQEPDSLGYSFWGTSNFAAATATNAKYLKVDGVDPIEDSYVTNGVLPTTANGQLTRCHFLPRQRRNLSRMVSAAAG